MANFIITGSGQINLRSTNLAGFDGVTFGTIGIATAQINTTLINGANITGGAFNDTLDIFVGAGVTYTGQAFSFTNWSANDLIVFRDAEDPSNTSASDETITGTGQRDRIHLAGGNDVVNGGSGEDILSLYYTPYAAAFVMANGNTKITDNADNSVSFSSIERFDIRLGTGDDVIVLGAGSDIIFGGAGDDSLDTRAGAAVVNGGSGTDRWSADLSAFAGAFTIDLSLSGVQNIGNGSSLDSIEVMSITGGGGNDSLKSRVTGEPDSPLNDIIDGSGGDDTVLVGGGVDTVTGGIGNDLLIIDYDGDSEAFFMANGNTTITDGVNTSVNFSGFERYEYRGSIGNDTIVLGAGADIASGNNGDDSLDTGAGAAIVDGGAGTDKWTANLSAFAGAFIINLGLAGVQNIGNGSSENSIEIMNVIGGTGNDTFTTIGGGQPDAPLNDTINGFDGNDTISVSCGIDTAIGGIGDDLLIIDYSNDNEAFAMAAGNTVITDGVNTSVTFSGFERMDYRGGEQSDMIVLSAGADIAKGNAGNDILTGGSGADILDGGAAVDTADYAEKTSAVVVFLNGGSDAVVTVGGSAEDTIRAFENLNGGSGNDSLVGDSAQNILRGNGGADFLFSNGFNPDGTLKAAAGNDTLDGGAGDDGLYGGDGIDTLNGGDGADGMVGGSGTDTLNGGAGADFLFGGAFSAGGAQLANSGADILNGGDGNDGLYGFDGADTINGDADNDYVEGGAGDDVVNGGAGSDYLLGQDGADTINGGTGFDYLYGGAAGDTFVFRKGDSADWVLDFSAAQGDKLRFLDFGYANFAAVPLVDLSTPGNPAVQLTFSGPGGVDQLTIFGATLAQLNATNVLVA